MNFQALAKKYDTPLYIYDFDYIKDRYKNLKTAFKARKSLICYALKANSNLSVIKTLAKEGAGADCVSIGEIKRALIAGIDPYKIIFSGVGKSDNEIKEALKLKILMVNVESEAELKRVEEIAKELNNAARISIRVNPNIDAKTHPYISTGLDENKFGVDIEVAKKLYLYAKNSKYLDPIGIHFHIGSQITTLKPFLEASKIIAQLVKNLIALEVDIKFFDIGGGLGIKYEDEKEIDLYEYAQGIFSTLKGLDLTILLEPGRFLVGNSGYFLTKVLYEKKNSSKRFIIVDGAMNDLLRPSLYDAFHKVSVVDEESSHSTLADVVGPICESGDFLAKDRILPKTKKGSLLVIHSVGAYGFSMSSNYNSRPKVAEVAIEDGIDRIIRKRESFEDLIRLEKECL
ncbi:MAG: diaminopimelate decarboxylase [Campylobacterales bacterium]|jgi:diaminopimelate decarboxylase|nr:diaminopimelate decarboxylase [Campylobacterales bacterium]